MAEKADVPNYSIRVQCVAKKFAIAELKEAQVPPADCWQTHELNA